MNIEEYKSTFVRYELSILSLKGGLSTRNKNYPIYDAKNIKIANSKRKELNHQIRMMLEKLYVVYKQEQISEERHIEIIEEFANQITQKCSDILHNGILRFGVTQKLVNLHLKYLWTIGLINYEPPHCPIDGIIPDAAGINYDWIKNDSKSDYMQAVSQLKEIAKPDSLSVWELKVFKRSMQD